MQGYPSDSYTDPNRYVQMLKAEEQKIGTNITLKVKAGDKVKIRASSWYQKNEVPGSNDYILSDLLLNLTSGVAGQSGGKVLQTELNAVGSPVLGGVSSFLSNQGINDYDDKKPMAFLNWILFDEQFKYVASSSGSDQVGDDNDFKVHTVNEVEMTKNGYLFVYTSNASTSQPVYFDNLQVTHIRGPIVEETHYYPFGLTMSGISSKALNFGEPKNSEKTFQGQRFDDELSLNYVQFKWRNHDPQIGRFIEIDPLADEYAYNSTYAFSENKVTNHIELEGLEAVSAGSPQGYLLEGFRQWFQAAGNLFSFKAEVHVNKEVEVKTEVKTPAGTVENKTTTTVSENKLELKTNFGDYFKNGGGKMVELNAESKSFPKVENTTTATVNTSGAPLKISTKTTVDENGKSQTVSVGTGTSANAGKMKVSVSATGFVLNSRMKLTQDKLLMVLRQLRMQRM